MNKVDCLYGNRGHIPDVQHLIEDACSKYTNEIYCKYWQEDRVIGKTYGELFACVRQYGHYIRRLLCDTKHVAMIGKTSFEWVCVYFALLYYGIVFVPLDRLLDPEELQRQTEFADVELLVYGDGYEETARYILENTPGCKHVLSLSALREVPAAAQTACDGARPQVPLDAVLEIVYTSGTTDIGKAVMLTHNNVLKTIQYGIRLVDLKPGDTVLSIMPNNHTYELTIGLLMPVYFGMTVAIHDDIKKRLRKNLALFTPTTMLVVPMLLQALKREVMAKVEKSGKKKAFLRAQRLCRIAAWFHIDLYRRFFKEIYDSLGSKLEFLICGGAFLSEDLIRFYEGIGIPILQGYGLTECAPIVSCNSTKHVKSDSLGQVGPFCEVRVVDNELWVKGENVMAGYYKNQPLTKEVMEHGWFKTGDLGYVDEQNFLYLTGRKKNLIILSNGENVNPEDLENKMVDIELFDTAVVYAEADSICVEVYPNQSYVEDRQITDVYSAVAEEIRHINEKLPLYKQIRIIRLRDTPFEKTTTLKVKRAALQAQN